MTRTGIATPTLDPLFGVTEDMEGSATVPADWFGALVVLVVVLVLVFVVVVGPADVLGFEAAVLGPPVVADTVVGAVDDMVDDVDDVVVVAEDVAADVSGAVVEGPAPALLFPAVLAHPVSSSNDPATAAPANFFPTAVPPLWPT